MDFILNLINFETLFCKEVPNAPYFTHSENTKLFKKSELIQATLLSSKMRLNIYWIYLNKVNEALID